MYNTIPFLVLLFIVPLNVYGIDCWCQKGPATYQEFFDNGLLMVAFTKAGVELAYETMVKNGIKAESAYYESLHEAPLIANTIARKKLYEMNRVISDTAEYGCYLFNHACIPLLSDFMLTVETNVIGESFSNQDEVNSTRLKDVDDEVENHPIEQVGARLRESMTAMQKLEVPAV